ncbi:hypothetical protein [Ectobacillus ponti]|uniref:Uncharacterized protein n=1 Tax=Ectobacillus ponti TaxID=2961894 RepID=A0AA41XA60_9BACI|nr:hypothetical protein [Ectobacillus ponti]MCP8969740.1 hypothetical protein [Ectobacillus ponti]
MGYANIRLDDFQQKQRRITRGPRSHKKQKVQVFVPANIHAHFLYKHKSKRFPSSTAYASSIFMRELLEEKRSEELTYLAEPPESAMYFRKVNIHIDALYVPLIERLQEKWRYKHFRTAVARIFYNACIREGASW